MIATLLVAAVGLLHVYILVLEMFLWTKPAGLRAFHLTQQVANDSKVLAANQGLYNGFLAAGLLWAAFAPPDMAPSLRVFFLTCVLIAGIYGGLTAHKKIFWFQGFPALAVLACILLRL